MADFFKRKLEYPRSIYVIVYSYFLLAIGANIWFFSNFTMDMVNKGMLVGLGIMVVTAIWPIQYKWKDMHVYLSFQFPILILFGLVPSFLVELFKLFRPKGIDKRLPKIKQNFNYANSIITDTITYLIFLYLQNLVPKTSYQMIIVILLTSFFYVIYQTGMIAIMVYLEKKQNLYKQQYLYIFNVLSSNVMNGIITYYLYQSLGILGLFISILYAILFSKRSQYQAAYDKKSEELREIEQRAKMVFDTIDYGVVILDKEHRIMLADPVAEQTLSQLDNEPMGKKIEEIGELYQSKGILEIIQRSYLQKEKLHQKNVRIPIDDEVHYYNVQTYPQMTENGELTGLIILYKNVTEERLIRRQLVEADKLSRLGQIAAGKVHEIKNPITTVRGYLQFLKQKVVSGDPINLNSFDIAIQEIDRTNELINSLLILSKQSQQNEEKVLLNHVVEEVIKLFEHQMLMENIDFRFEDKGEFYIRAVENHMKQILINLFLNAVDALKENKVDPQISLKIYQQKEDVLIEFKDNGIGISEKNLERLHEPFFTTKENGTGLGLSVTYKLIEEHKGTIRVFSKVGLGTTFTIRIPILSNSNEVKANVSLIEKG